MSHGLGWIQLAVMGGISAVQTGIALWKSRRKPQQKIATTQIVDDAERILQANLSAFSKEPTRTNQTAALRNFDDVWDEVTAACSDPAMGQPGRNCVSERARGGRWDWFAAYRDPIEQADLMADPDPLPFLSGGVAAAADSGALFPVAGLALVVLGVMLSLGGAK